MNTVLNSLKGRLLFGTMKTSFSSANFLCAAVLIFHLAVEPGHAAGTVVAWGGNDFSQSTVPAGLTNITAVAGGALYSLALKSTGAVVGWGDNTYGAASSPSNLLNAVAIAAGNGFSLALQSNGTVVAWGGQTTVPAGLTNVVAVSAASSNKMALTSDGNVVSWGVVAPPPATVTNVVAIAAGYTHSVALLGNGTVAAWGKQRLGTEHRARRFVQCRCDRGGRFSQSGAAAEWHRRGVGRQHVSSDQCPRRPVQRRRDCRGTLSQSGGGGRWCAGHHRATGEPIQSQHWSRILWRDGSGAGSVKLPMAAGRHQHRRRDQFAARADEPCNVRRGRLFGNGHKFIRNRHQCKCGIAARLAPAILFGPTARPSVLCNDPAT